MARMEAGKKSRNPEEAYRRHLWRKYKLTLEGFYAMLARQQNKCALCPATNVDWKVDHCHTTGRVRGLLCNGCNMRLGSFEALLKTSSSQQLLEYIRYDDGLGYVV